MIKTKKILISVPENLLDFINEIKDSEYKLTINQTIIDCITFKKNYLNTQPTIPTPPTPITKPTTPPPTQPTKQPQQPEVAEVVQDFYNEYKDLFEESEKFMLDYLEI